MSALDVNYMMWKMFLCRQTCLDLTLTDTKHKNLKIINYGDKKRREEGDAGGAGDRRGDREQKAEQEGVASCLC